MEHCVHTAFISLLQSFLEGVLSCGEKLLYSTNVASRMKSTVNCSKLSLSCGIQNRGPLQLLRAAPGLRWSESGPGPVVNLRQGKASKMHVWSEDCSLASQLDHRSVEQGGLVRFGLVEFSSHEAHTRMHHGKKTSWWRQCDTWGDALLGALRCYHRRGC